MLITYTMLLMNSCQYNMKICISYEYIIYLHNKIAICAIEECKYAHVCFLFLGKGRFGIISVWNIRFRHCLIDIQLHTSNLKMKSWGKYGFLAIVVLPDSPVYMHVAGDRTKLSQQCDWTFPSALVYSKVHVASSYGYGYFSIGQVPKRKYFLNLCLWMPCWAKPFSWASTESVLEKNNSKA